MWGVTGYNCGEQSEIRARERRGKTKKELGEFQIVWLTK